MSTTGLEPSTSKREGTTWYRWARSPLVLWLSTSFNQSICNLSCVCENVSLDRGLKFCLRRHEVVYGCVFSHSKKIIYLLKYLFRLIENNSKNRPATEYMLSKRTPQPTGLRNSIHNNMVFNLSTGLHGHAEDQNKRLMPKKSLYLKVDSFIVKHLPQLY